MTQNGPNWYQILEKIPFFDNDAIKEKVASSITSFNWLNNIPDCWVLNLWTMVYTSQYLEISTFEIKTVVYWKITNYQYF